MEAKSTQALEDWKKYGLISWLSCFGVSSAGGDILAITGYGM